MVNFIIAYSHYGEFEYDLIYNLDSALLLLLILKVIYLIKAKLKRYLHLSNNWLNTQDNVQEKLWKSLKSKVTKYRKKTTRIVLIQY